jgi:hypothetical protein
MPLSLHRLLMQRKKMPEDINSETQQFEQQETEIVENTPQPQAPQAQEERQIDYNFRAIRERAEAAERRNAELERILQSSMQKQPSPDQAPIEEEDIDLSDDSFVEAKHLKKYVKSIKSELRATKEKMEEYRKSSSLEQAEVRLKSQFNDFDDVVTQENLKKLAASKPALYRSIMANNDIYDRGYTAYDMIKSSGLIDKVYDQQDKKIEGNKSKPRSAANASPQTAETPLTRLGDYDRRVLTEERKEQLRRQVEEAKRYR